MSSLLEQAMIAGSRFALSLLIGWGLALPLARAAEVSQPLNQPKKAASQPSPAVRKAATAAASKPKDQPEEKVEEKEVTGDVVTVTKYAISVEFAKTPTASEEILLPFDAKTSVEGPRKIAELKFGDRVKVTYQQTSREDDQGHPVILKTVATQVALLRSATSESALRSTDTVTP